MKEVIIDKVDVAECGHYRAEIETETPFGEYEIEKDKCYYSGIKIIQDCKGNKGCMYKRLKRLEQENEKLKKELEKHKSMIAHNLKPLFDSDFQNKLKELEQENKLLNDFLNHSFCDCELNEKYRQTLQEIREIAEKDFRHTAWEEYARQLKEIITKINEVIGAEE